MDHKAVLLCLLASVVSFAEPRALSAHDAVILALARNPDLLALRKGRAVAEASIAQATLLPNPELKFSFSDVAGDINSLESLRNNVGLRWSPPRVGAIGLKSEVAQRNVQIAGDAIAVAEQKLAAEVRLLHQMICLMNEQIKLADEDVQAREHILKIADAQMKAGVKSALDRSMAEISLADARPVLERYRSERLLQMSRLASKLAFPQSQVLKLQTDGDPYVFTETTIEREKLLPKALGSRMELDAAGARCTQAELNLKSTRRDRYPWLSYVQVDRRFRRRQDTSNWGFQVGVDLPVFRWQSEVLQASLAELDRCKSQEEAVKAGIVAELDEVLLLLEATTKELKQHQDVIISLSSRHVELAQSALAAGESDAIEPIVAQVREIGARQAFVTKLMNLRALEIGLDQALGNAIR